MEGVSARAAPRESRAIDSSARRADATNARRATRERRRRATTRDDARRQGRATTRGRDARDDDDDDDDGVNPRTRRDAASGRARWAMGRPRETWTRRG